MEEDKTTEKFQNIGVSEFERYCLKMSEIARKMGGPLKIRKNLVL